MGILFLPDRDRMMTLALLISHCFRPQYGDSFFTVKGKEYMTVLLLVGFRPQYGDSFFTLLKLKI